MKKLFTAIRQGRLDEVRELIEKKPELVNCISGPTPKKDRGQSPLQVAFRTGNYEIANYLLACGADVNFMEAEDGDPGLRAPVLFDAVNASICSLCYNDFAGSDAAFGYVKRLIAAGADVNKLASNGHDAITWSITRSEMIFERASAYPDIQNAARSRLTEILDLLIENGADYVAWAGRSYVAAPYEGPSNKNSYIDDFVPRNEGDFDRVRHTRAFVQQYFRSRNLQL